MTYEYYPYCLHATEYICLQCKKAPKSLDTGRRISMAEIKYKTFYNLWALVIVSRNCSSKQSSCTVEDLIV